MGSIFKSIMLKNNSFYVPVLTMYRGYSSHQMAILDFYHRTMGNLTFIKHNTIFSFTKWFLFSLVGRSLTIN